MIISCPETSSKTTWVMKILKPDLKTSDFEHIGKNTDIRNFCLKNWILIHFFGNFFQIFFFCLYRLSSFTDWYKNVKLYVMDSNYHIALVLKNHSTFYHFWRASRLVLYVVKISTTWTAILRLYVSESKGEFL